MKIYYVSKLTYFSYFSLHGKKKSCRSPSVRQAKERFRFPWEISLILPGEHLESRLPRNAGMTYSLSIVQKTGQREERKFLEEKPY